MKIEELLKHFLWDTDLSKETKEKKPKTLLLIVNEKHTLS